VTGASKELWFLVITLFLVKLKKKQFEKACCSMKKRGGIREKKTKKKCEIPEG